MSLALKLDPVLAALRDTQARLLAPLQHEELLLPKDPEMFVEDVLHYVMDAWAEDLRKQGHVLEEVTSWKDHTSQYPRYQLHLRGGGTLDLLFAGIYPESLYLHIGKVEPGSNRFSDAKAIQIPLTVTNDPNTLLLAIVGGLRLD